MPTHRLEGAQKLQLTNDMAIVCGPNLRGVARTPDPTSAEVLSRGLPKAAPSPVLQLDDFVAAQPPVELQLEPTTPRTLQGAPPAAAPTDVAGMIEMQTEPGASYILLHEIHTPDGMIYDITMPQSVGSRELEEKPAHAIPGTIQRFHFHRMVDADMPPQAPATPRSLSDEPAGDLISAGITHVLHLLKAPAQGALHSAMADWEGKPQFLAAAPDGAWGDPLTGFEAWRARFAPEQEHRLLLYVHGFGSNLTNTFRSPWVSAFPVGYDMVLGYNHPTLTTDPVQNAADILQQIPEDVRLHVDIMAHSRGGLVARSLVELQQARANLHVQRLITFGTPHAGTPLANPDRWDRLISISFTTMNWLAGLLGASVPTLILGRALEFLLRAGSQAIFDLPGIEAMNPQSDFLRALNAPGKGGAAQPTRYAAVASSFDAEQVQQTDMLEALKNFALQSFLKVPNDLVVPTKSMTSIDLPDAVPLGGRVHQSNVNHFSYFNVPDVQTFTRDFLAS